MNDAFEVVAAHGETVALKTAAECLLACHEKYYAIPKWELLGWCVGRRSGASNAGAAHTPPFFRSEFAAEAGVGLGVADVGSKDELLVTTAP